MNLPKIYLLSISPTMVDAWNDAFEDEPDVIVVHGDFARFMDKHPEVDCIVSPANSYGLMDGSYDYAITKYFDKELMRAVQSRILDVWFGEQPVGTSISVKHKGITLIHTPTMRIPSTIVDPMVVYHSMRSTLVEALRDDVRAMVVPAFGAGCGMLPFDVVATLMAAAYRQVANPPTSINWEYATSRSLPDSERN